MTVRDFIEVNAHVQVRWFDRPTGEQLFDVQMPKESKHHFRDRTISMIYRTDSTGERDGYTLDIYVHHNSDEDIWLKGEKK